MIEFLTVINYVLGHEYAVPNRIDRPKVQYHTGKVQTQAQVVNWLILGHRFYFEFTGGQDGNAEHGLDKQQEQCLKVVLGLVL